MQYVVTTTKNRTRFYLTLEDTGTDIFDRAHIYKWNEDAKRAAQTANSARAWAGFTWKVALVNSGCDLCGDGAVDSGLCPVCEEGLELADDANCDGYEEE